MKPMKSMKLILIILFIALLFTPTSIAQAASNKNSSAATSTSPQGYSTWLWDTNEITYNSDNILTFLVNNHVTTVYLQVNYNLDYSYYQDFISRASANNIAVHALDGSPDWVMENGGVYQDAFFAWVADYQANSAVAAQFKGIHLDVEPYHYSTGYNTDPNAVLNRYQDFLLNAKNAASSLSLNLGIDIPFWFNEVSYSTGYGTGNLAAWIFNNIKTVTIMAYRDTAAGANGINQLAAAEMTLAKQYNASATIAVETENVGDPTYVTFFEEGSTYMYNELNLVRQYFSKNRAFSGIGIHHLDSWMSMNP